MTTSQTSSMHPNGKISLDSLLNHRDGTSDCYFFANTANTFAQQNAEGKYPPQLPVSLIIPKNSFNSFTHILDKPSVRASVDHMVSRSHGHSSNSLAIAKNTQRVSPSTSWFPGELKNQVPFPAHHDHARPPQTDRFSSPVRHERHYSSGLLQTSSIVNTGSFAESPGHSSVRYSLPPIGGVRHGGLNAARNFHFLREKSHHIPLAPPGKVRSILSRTDSRHSRRPAIPITPTVGPGPRAGTYCRKCGKTFKTKQGAHRHNQTVHLKLRPFQCADCANRFGQKCSLQRHQRSVHKKKDIRFACEHVGCNELYEDYRHLQQHIKIVHQGSPPFKCDVGHCTSTFMWASSYENHLANCHGCDGARVRSAH